ncbi:MAG: aminotransferase class I/II-fold pyridoxal phosphate-dependent enzyme [Sumerlaeia bacterium]
MSSKGNSRSLLAEISDSLSLREKSMLLRTLRPLQGQQAGHCNRAGKSLINLSHNDYLGLARHPKVVEAAQQATAQWGTGAEASRLITGTLQEHELFEQEYAEFKGASSCLLFPTGYQASLSVFSALAKLGDNVYCDRLVHSCLVDGIALSGARMRVFPHQNMERLYELLVKDNELPGGGRTWICVDGVYSMDGDIAPLPQLLEMCKTFGAYLVVDDAHGTGMIGETGRGIFEHFGINFKEHEEYTILISTLSKGLGSQGGAVCCHPTIRQQLINTAKPFIFTTALAPSCAAAARAALQVIKSTPSLVKGLQQRWQQALKHFRDAGFNCLSSQTGIIPILVGEEGDALYYAEQLEDQGLLLLPIRPPTVPKGTSRLRLSVNMLLTDAEWSSAVEQIPLILKQKNKL